MAFNHAVFNFAHRDHNSQARTRNSLIWTTGVTLTSLVTENNEEIPNFPRDIEAIAALTGQLIF